MPQASQFNQQPVRPPPPPGYFDADATPTPAAVKPPPPAGYFDADAAPTPALAVPTLQKPSSIDIMAEPKVKKPQTWTPEEQDKLHNQVQEGMRWGVVGEPRPHGLNEPIVKYDESVNLPHDQQTEEYLAGLKAKDKRPEPTVNGVELANRGIARGAQHMAEGLTTPANLGIAAATASLGSVPGVAGNALRAMVSGYFSEQMLADAYHKIPEIRAAADAGDTEKLAELVTNEGLNLGMGVAAGTHAGAEVMGAGARGMRAYQARPRPTVEPRVEAPSATATALDSIKLAPLDEGVVKREPFVAPVGQQSGVNAGIPNAGPKQAYLPQPLPEGTHTEHVYRNRLTGDWDPGRSEAVHYPAVDAELAGKEPPQGRKPEAVIMNGGTASGKSTVAKKLMGEDPGRVNIDADKMKLAIPEFDELKKTDPDNATARVQNESAQMAKRLLVSAADKGLDIVYDRTTAGGDILKYLKEKGYYVKVVGVDIPTEMAKERALKRATESTDQTGRGRFVPEKVIEEKHVEAAQEGLAALASPHVDEVHLLDNQEGPVPIVSRVDGEEPVVHNGERLEALRRKAQGNEATLPATDAARNVPGPAEQPARQPAGTPEARAAGAPTPADAESAGAYRPVTGTGAVVKVPTAEIGTDSARFQPRKGLNTGRVEAIRQNMERSGEFGDKFPLDVWRDPQTGRLNVLAGHHRFEAAKAAGLSEVTARLHEDLSPEEAADFARRSNSQAAPLTPIENARAFRSEMDSGRTAAEIGKEYGGINSTKVEDLAKLTTLPPELQDHIQDGVLSPEMGIALAKSAERHGLPSELMAEVYDKIIKTNEMTPTELSRMMDTLAPAAAKQMKMGLGFELPTGFTDPLKDYLGKIRELNSTRNAMRRYANEVQRMERTGQKVTKAELSARDQAVRRVEKLQDEVSRMEKDLGRGKLPSAQAAMREPEVLPTLKPSGAPQVQSPTDVLPGMEPTVKAEQEAAGRVQAEKLTEKASTPTSIEEAAGNMERESPLFRNSGAGGQSTLYSNPIPQLMKAWSEGTGKAAWDWLENSVINALPEWARRGLVTNYGLPEEYVGARRQTNIATGEGFEKAKSTGARMAEDLTQEQQQALGRLFKGEATEADISGLRSDARWNDAVEATKQARAMTDDIGFQAVMQNMLKDETFFRNQGKYMPRLYRKWEVDYDSLAKDYGGAPTRLDLQRFKERKDIPESVRLQMGEIKEPAYPFAKGYSQMVHDVELQKLFRFVADRPDWAATDLDTLFTAGKDQADYVQMPETKKLGPLSGKWVNKYIADDINQMTRAKSDWEKFSSNLLGEWKFGKVVISPATHARNMMSNTILNQLGGLPVTRIDMYYKALRELADEGPIFQEAKKAGLVRGTFNKAEISGLLDAWNRAPGGSLGDRMHGMLADIKEGRPLSAVGVGPTSKLGAKVGNVYQAEELWFKMAKVLHNKEQGMDTKAAVDDAHKWLFDYSEVPKYVAWARRTPFGSPFITFTAKALPRVAESLVRAPWRAGAVAATIYAANGIASGKLGLDKEDLRRIEAVKPDRMRENIPGVQKYLLLPWKDKYGQLQYLDLTYILPWGDIGETQVQALEGVPGQALFPMVTSPVKALFEVGINHSSFTGKDIFKQTDTTAEKSLKVADYLWKTAAPTIAPGGYGFERMEKAVTRKPDYFGRVSSIPTAAASTLLGIKVSPLDPAREGVYREHEAQTVLRELEAEARSVSRSQARSPGEKQKELATLREKAARYRKELARRYNGEPQVTAGGH